MVTYPFFLLIVGVLATKSASYITSTLQKEVTLQYFKKSLPAEKIKNCYRKTFVGEDVFLCLETLDAILDPFILKGKIISLETSSPPPGYSLFNEKKWLCLHVQQQNGVLLTLQIAAAVRSAWISFPHGFFSFPITLMDKHKPS